MSKYTPAPFQVEDIAHLEPLDWSANWSEMGCYKTSTVCWLIDLWAKRLEKKNPRILIVTTRTGKGTYFRHIPDILPDYELINVNATKSNLVLDGMDIPIDDIPTGHDGPIVCVSHYNVFTKRKPRKAKDVELSEEEELLQKVIDSVAGKKASTNLDKIKKIHWDIIILDEAHRIKDKKTGWTKEIKKLKGTIRHVMTGTGFINDPSEIWSLLHFLNRGEFSSYWRFRETFCDEDFVDGYRRILGVKKSMSSEFRSLVRTIGPRRTKPEVFKDLAHPIYSPVGVELSAVQRTVYDGIRDELYALDQEGAPIYSPNVLSALQRLRQVCVATPKVISDIYDPIQERRIQKIELVEPSSKLDALMEIIDGLEWDEERRDQIVVFSNFKDPIKLALARFEKKGISYIHMKQADNDKVRYQKWAIEFPKKEHQVFICTLQLGSESISLTSANTCVFLDRSWSPKDNNQGESRVWRPGQEGVANIIYINAEETVDDRILRRVQQKNSWFEQIFGPEVIDDETELDDQSTDGLLELVSQAGRGGYLRVQQKS